MNPEKSSVGWRKRPNSNGGSFWSRLFFGIIFLAFLGVAGYVLFFSHFLLINSIEVEGVVNADREIVKEIGQNAINGKYLNFLDKRNIILANTWKMKREVLEKFKIIQSVEIKRKFPDKLKIIIFEREPALALSSNSRCFMVDKAGVAFDEMECGGNYLGNNSYRVLINESNKEVSLGEKSLEPDYINFISSFSEETESNLEIGLEREMRTPGIVSADIRMKTKEGWEIFLNENLSARKELEMLQVVLENKISAEQRNDLEYIDLRTENRVYYKFKNSENSSQENNKDTQDKKVETKTGKKSG